SARAGRVRVARKAHGPRDGESRSHPRVIFRRRGGVSIERDMHAGRRYEGPRFVALAIALALLLAGCLPIGPPEPPRDAHARVGRDGRWFIDANGRVVGMRGVNFVQKFPPVSPSSVGFGDDDAAFLAHEGFNLVRLGVVFGAVMPQPGVIDTKYVAAIAHTTS